jgi:hypothetical protein
MIEGEAPAIASPVALDLRAEARPRRFAAESRE